MGVLVGLLLSLSGVGRLQTVVDRVDLIERNQVSLCSGQITIDQVIFWEWSPDYRRYEVIAWRLIDGDENRLPYQLPCGNWCVRWFDRQVGLWREVRSNKFRSTTTQHDPEMFNKRLHAESFRSNLSRSFR